MLLIADSGSTKTDWLLWNGKNATSFSSIGFNPFFHDSASIFNNLKENPLTEFSTSIDMIFFYGAGCHNEVMQEVVATGLRMIFPKATIKVSHDMAGAVYATCGKEPGITAILGTGSNSCYFDGESISEKVPSLGYILGDEGGGDYLGKMLIIDYLYHRTPEEITQYLAQMGHSKDSIFEHVYRKPHANVYLAGFSKVLQQFIHLQYTDDLVIRAFRAFRDTHLLCFEQAGDVPIHFIGSVAMNFKTQLEKVLHENGLRVGIYTNKPIQNLLEFHLHTEGR